MAADPTIHALGIDLSGYRSTMTSAEMARNKTTPHQSTWQSEVPNICVLPRIAAERPRVGMRAVNGMWARGVSFPPTGNLGPGLSRIPSWLAWDVLGQEDVVTPQWRYRIAESQTDTSIPISAIMKSFVAMAVNGCQGSSRDGPRVVAMPDHFSERSQENLLSCLPWSRDDDRRPARLLWRSVAAVLSWAAGVPPSRIQHFDRQHVAVVDVMNAEITVTVLELRVRAAKGRKFLVPKRDLPEKHTFFRWPTIPFDFALCDALLRKYGCKPRLENLWQLCLGSECIYRDNEGSPLADVWIESNLTWQRFRMTTEALCLAADDAMFGSLTRDWGELWRLVDASSSALDHTYDCERHGQVLDTALPHWLRSLDTLPMAIILSGPVLDFRGKDGTLLASQVASHLTDKTEVAVACGGRGMPERGGISHGCALYGIYEQAGLPTYLDTLPRFSILGKDETCLRDVEYDLLELPSGDRVVEGGKEYYRGPDQLRNAAKISSGQRSVLFKLKRESIRKQLDQKFGVAPLEDCMLSFEVRMRPAQGFARVRIIPAIGGLFSDREVVMDWDRMEPYDQAVDQFDPGFPPCQPLLPDSYRQNFVKPAIFEYVEAVRAESWRVAEAKLDDVGRRLQSGRAYGSDPEGTKGVTLWGRKDEIQSFIDALNQHYHQMAKWKTVERYRRRRDEVATRRLKSVIRAATALYRKTSQWAASFLEEEFTHARETEPENPRITPVFLNAAGRCFATPDQIRLYTQCMTARFQNRIEYRRDHPAATGLQMNNWCKGLQLVLRLNEEAVLDITPSVAKSLAEGIGYLLEVEVERVGFVRPGVSAPYKHAMLTLYFLLRFRAPNENKDFLTNWKRRNTMANRIWNNLTRTDRGKTSWRRPSNVVLNQGESLQASLIRFLESRATVRDITIMDSGHMELLDSSTQDTE